MTVLSPLPTSTRDVDTAVSRSVDASARWASGSPRERARWLHALADGLTAHAEELVGLADEETSLGPTRLQGELARTAMQLRKFADVVLDGAYLEATIDHALDTDVPPRPDLRRVLVPLGPVAVWAASNFPFAFSVLGGDTASALAAGNAVIVKAHEGHPRLSRRVAEIAGQSLQDAGGPRDSVQLVFSREAGSHLITHRDIAAGAFTGSIPGGRALFDLAAARPEPIPFYGELGSINPVVITAAAAADRGAELAAGLAGSFTMGAGQFCTKPGVVFVPAGTSFGEALVDATSSAATAPMLNDRIRSAFRSDAGDLAARPEVETIGGGLPSTAGDVGPLVLRTTTTHVLAAPDALLSEVFGPATLLVEYDGDDDLRRSLSVVPGSLTGTIHAVDDEDVTALVATLAARVGRVLFSGWPTGVAVSWAQHHGGPYPATTSLFTSVGASAIRRFLRPLTYQSAPPALLPPALRDDNPLGIPRRVNGVLTLAGK